MTGACLSVSVVCVCVCVCSCGWGVVVVVVVGGSEFSDSWGKRGEGGKDGRDSAS